MTKPWGGRFEAEGGKGAEGFTSSLSFDRRLYRQDIAGSMAHARMLGRIGVLSEEEVRSIVSGLEEIEEELERGDFPFRIEYEDIHLNIEKRLVEKIGPVGGKLHTARSRNDQVVTDMHLFIKEEVAGVRDGITELQAALVEAAEKHFEVIVPGYTHLQRAQPVLLAHHLLAYAFMLERDYERFGDCFRRADRLPLGAGALAGSTFPVDPQSVAVELGFAGIYENSMDAVSDRDFLLDFLAAASILMMHLSRFCEEIVLWSSQEFSFLELDDTYSTGSSMMPQKKNPDVAELVRGKTGRVYGHLLGLLTVMKGLPLAYHSDMQEDKEAIFDTVDTVRACLSILPGLIRTMKFNRERMTRAVMEDFSPATDLADYLVRKGVPFREAHGMVGRLVLSCIREGRLLGDLSHKDLVKFSEFFDQDAIELLSPERCVAARGGPMGTAPEAVRENITRLKARLEARCR